MSQNSPTFTRYRGGGGEDASPLASGGSLRRERGRYLASPELVIAVNTALAAEQPLLVTGEPGTGKTTLAESIAEELGLGQVLQFNTRSDHQARDVLYTFDSMRRFYDAQVQSKDAMEPRNYVKDAPLGQAIRSPTQRVVLIDEIDKAPRDFPNDLLNAIDRMVLEIPETGEVVSAKYRPIVVITSNGERQLPDAFLRRCVFHHIDFPAPAELAKILRQRLGEEDRLEPLYQAAVERFTQLRSRYGHELAKKPATGELLVWVRVLIRAGASPSEVARNPPPYLAALLKTERDLKMVLGVGAAAA
jgi:MoxR-like ATPase